jgi:hypothetical protein
MGARETAAPPNMALNLYLKITLPFDPLTRTNVFIITASF